MTQKLNLGFATCLIACLEEIADALDKSGSDTELIRDSLRRLEVHVNNQIYESPDVFEQEVEDDC